MMLMRTLPHEYGCGDDRVEHGTRVKHEQTQNESFILGIPRGWALDSTGSVHAFKALAARYGKDGELMSWCCYRCSGNVRRNSHLPDLVA